MQIDWALVDVTVLLVFGLLLFGFDVLSKALACLIVTCLELGGFRVGLGSGSSMQQSNFSFLVFCRQPKGASLFRCRSHHPKDLWRYRYIFLGSEILFTLK